MTGRVAQSLSAAVVVVIATQLGCFGQGEPYDVCYDCDERLSPAKQSQYERAKLALLGTWRIQADLTGRDEVDRPLALGRVSWLLEIRAVTPYSSDVQDTGYDWWGTLRAEDLCLVDLESFNRDGGECTPLEPAVLGSCSGRECSYYTEHRVDGEYDVATDELELDMVSGDVYFLDHAVGYVDLEIDIDFDRVLEQSEEALECEYWCSFWLDPAGLFEGEFPELSSTEWTTSMTWIGDQHRDPLAPVDDERRTIEIGLQSDVENVLLGDWSVRVELAVDGDGGSTVPIGYATYLLNIFEVEDAYEMGEWSFKGGLTGVDLCIAPVEELLAQTLECDLLEPVGNGYCSYDGCTERGEAAVTGDYDQLEHTLRIDWASADLFFYDADLGFVHLDNTIYLDSAPLVDERIAPTSSDAWSTWSLYTSGTCAETYGDGWYGDDKTISIWR